MISIIVLCIKVRTFSSLVSQPLVTCFTFFRTFACISSGRSSTAEWLRWRRCELGGEGVKCWNIVFRFFTTLPCPLKGKFSWVVEELTLVVAVVGVSELGVCSGKLVVA